MAKKEVLRLVAGFRRFRRRYFLEKKLYKKLSTEGQHPKSLIIACSDSRVDPAIITSASPGEFFSVRNVANLVPPFETTLGLHGVSSAIEFAVVDLKVENVIVLGHRQCGGVRALMQDGPKREGSFLSEWVQIGRPARDRVLQKYANEDFESQCRHCEMESIVTSLENLRTFPFIDQAVRERGLELIGIYFDLEEGKIYEFDEQDNEFKAIEV